MDDQKIKLIEEQKAKPGMRGRVNAKCIECIYDPLERGNWRKQVQACTAPSCPLYDIRAKSEGSAL